MEEEIVVNYVPWVDIITVFVIFSLVVMKLKS